MARVISSLILVYDADAGLAAMLADVVKKALGREDCALCEITYGPLGKRQSWQTCERRLGVPVTELHRDEIPADWEIDRAQLPCVLARTGEAKPQLLVAKATIIACGGRVQALEEALDAALRAGLPD